MLEACFEFNASLGISLFSYICSSKLLVDLSTLRTFHKIVAKLLKGNQNIDDSECDRSMMITGSIIDTNPGIKRLRRRAYTDEGEIKIFVREICRNCQKKIETDEILEQLSFDPQTYDCVCHNCNSAFQPQLKVRNSHNIIFVETLLLSPKALRLSFVELIKDKELPLKLDVDMLRTHLPMIY